MKNVKNLNDKTQKILKIEIYILQYSWKNENNSFD